MLQLVHALASFADTLADLRNALDRLHRASAARAAVAILRNYQPSPAAASRLAQPTRAPAMSQAVTPTAISSLRPSGR
jgi:hypothetical protein